MDANWFPDYAWGSRDIMTATNTVRIGAFRQEYSYPRNEKGLIIEESWEEKTYRKDYQEKLPEKPNTYSLFPFNAMQELYKMLKDAKKEDKKFNLPSEAGFQAVLDEGNIPGKLSNKLKDCNIELLNIKVIPRDDGWQITGEDKVTGKEKVYNIKKAILKSLIMQREESKLEVYEDHKEEIRKWLELHKFYFWGRKIPMTVKITDDAFERMMKWPTQGFWKRTWGSLIGVPPKRPFEEHNDYKRPNDIFKLWLFPTCAWELTPFELGSGKWRMGTGLQFSNFKFFRQRNVGIYLDFNPIHREFYDISIIVESFRGRNYNFYGGIGWGKRERKSSDNCCVVSGGMTIISWDIQATPVLGALLYNLPGKIPKVGSTIEGCWGHTQIALRCGLRSELHGAKPWKIDHIRPQIGLSFVRNLWNPWEKHPLKH
jgi:hypothetical protein